MGMMVDNEEGLGAGDVVFVSNVFNSNTGTSETRASLRPSRTNMSREVKLRGWCGETNNLSREALGVAVVSRVFPKSGRMQIRLLRAGSREEREALDSIGFRTEGRPSSTGAARAAANRPLLTATVERASLDYILAHADAEGGRGHVIDRAIRALRDTESILAVEPLRLPSSSRDENR